MQIQPVNNNNGTNFGAIKGIKYSGVFKPEESLKHAKIVDKALNSKAIKKFSEKYDFILNFDIHSCLHSYICNLHFEPVKEKPQNGCINKITKFFKNIFRKEEPRKPEKSDITNLPCKFSTCHDWNENYGAVDDSFLNKVGELTEENINTRLKMEISNQKQVANDMAEQKRLLEKIQKKIDKLGIKKAEENA